MDAAAELGMNPVSKHLIQPEYGDEQAYAGRDCRTCETKFSGTNADREIFIFPFQLTTSRIGNLTRLIHTLAIYVYTPILSTSQFHTISGCGKREAHISLSMVMQRQHPLLELP